MQSPEPVTENNIQGSVPGQCSDHMPLPVASVLLVQLLGIAAPIPTAAKRGRGNVASLPSQIGGNLCMLNSHGRV